MAIKATLKKAKGPAPTVTTDAPQKGQVIDVPATVETDLEAAVAGEAGAPEAQEPATTAVATRSNNTALARYSENNSAGVSGDWGAIKAKLPQIKVVQGSGKLSQMFNIGTVIFDDVELFPPINKAKKETPYVLRFVPMHLDLQFRQKLTKDEMDEGMMPAIFNSVREVEEAGLTTEWGPDSTPQPGYCAPSARCLFLIEKPEGVGSDHPGFIVDLEGKQYAVAVYYSAGGAFTACAKVIKDTLDRMLFVPLLDEEGKPRFNGKLPLKEKLLYKCFWTISWDTKKSGNFTPYVPTVQLLRNEETSDEIRSYIATNLSAHASRAAAAPVED